MCFLKKIVKRAVMAYRVRRQRKWDGDDVCYTLVPSPPSSQTPQIPTETVQRKFLPRLVIPSSPFKSFTSAHPTPISTPKAPKTPETPSSSPKSLQSSPPTPTSLSSPRTSLSSPRTSIASPTTSTSPQTTPLSQLSHFSAIPQRPNQVPYQLYSSPAQIRRLRRRDYAAQKAILKAQHRASRTPFPHQTSDGPHFYNYNAESTTEIAEEPAEKLITVEALGEKFELDPQEVVEEWLFDPNEEALVDYDTRDDIYFPEFHQKWTVAWQDFE